MARAALKKIEDAPQDAPLSGGVEEMILTKQDSGDLDAMFGELEAELESAGVNTGPAVPLNDNEDDHIAAGQHISVEDLKAKALEELEEQSKPLSDESRKPEPQKKKAPATKRISTLGLTVSQSLAQGLGPKLDELLTLDVADLSLSDEEAHAKRHELMASLDDKLPKKIGEKVVNLFASIAKGANLSTYTRIAIDLLVKDREITSKTLKDQYIARPYSEGTASSQATQMMKLLPLLGIAHKEAGKLVLNDSSLLLHMLTEPAPEAEAE
ncbi:hypothetical protein hairong_096 [Pseudomonas phage hairong]|nr:hypothetical protein hairong_096 [Pseudomonas phage hairong]